MRRVSQQLDFDALFAEEPKSAPDSVDDWVGPPRRRKPVCGPPRVRPAVIDRAVQEATVRADSGDWDGATPQLLVGLYVVCHERVYGVRPLELGAANWLPVVSMATKQLRDRFESNVPAMVEYVRWTWNRERNRREYMLRRAAEEGQQPRDMRRISWSLQFGHTSPLLTDYFASRNAR